MDSGKVGSEGLEYMTNFSEKNDLMDKEIKAINSFNNNTKNYNVNNNYKEFGGLLGAFCLILLMPLVVIAAQLFCTQVNDNFFFYIKVMFINEWLLEPFRYR